MRNVPCLTLIVSLVCGTALASGDPVQPLSSEHRAVVYGTAEDVLDKEVCVGTRKRVTLKCRDELHYITTNEWYHQIWRPYIAGIGGAYVGVAADQGFTFMAWARSEIAFMTDYDPVVVWLNHVHVAFLRASDNVAAFVARYDRKGWSAGQKLLEQTYAQHPDRKRIVRTYRTYRRSLTRHWKRVLKRKWSASHFTHREEWYRYVRDLARNDRIRVMRGDLLKDKSLRGVAEITHKLKIPMRVVYTSNAEEFWPYPKDFRLNFSSMLMDSKSVVLRTRHSDKYGPRIGAYVYIVQDGQHFQNKLKDPKCKGLWVVMRDRKPGRQGFFTIGPVEVVKADEPNLGPPPRRHRRATKQTEATTGQ